MERLCTYHPGGERPIEQIRNGADVGGMLESYHWDAVPKRAQLQVTPSLYDEMYRTEMHRSIKKDVHAHMRQLFGPKPRPSLFYFVVWILHVLAIFASVALLAVLSFSSYPLTCICIAILLGLLRGTMITRETHAASHYAWIGYGETINTFIYAISIMIAGSTMPEWTKKHIEKHHLFTSVNEIDDDSIYPLKRVSAQQEYRWWHRYQCYYMPIFYAVILFFWQLSNVLYTPAHYGTRHFFSHLLSSCCHIFLFYIAPYYTDGGLIKTLPVLIVSSLFFTMRFVVNHEVITCQQYADEIQKERKVSDWAEYQIRTSTEYATDSWIENQLSGGLNHQVIHHLFPGIHYSFYHELAPIVYQIIKDKNIPITIYPSHYAAICGHFQLLDRMSRSSPDNS